MVQEVLSFLVLGSARLAKLALAARNGFGCAALLALPHAILWAAFAASIAVIGDVTTGSSLATVALSTATALLQWAAWRDWL